MQSMKRVDSWIISDCWLACFDILGFGNLINVDKDDFAAFNVRVKYEETIENLRKKCDSYRLGYIDYCWFSDTFLMFCPDNSPEAYVMIQSAAKHFMHTCIYSRIPMRGAITVGSLLRSPDKRSFVGKGFLEAFKYAEDQDWIGLLLTPNAIKKIESYGSSLIDDFVRSDDIPMRKFVAHNVLAYRFQNGAANYPCPLLPMLNEMKMSSKEQYRHKYERTEKFIKEHYSWLA